MGRDGTQEGYDISFTQAISETVDISIIASGGCGTLSHIDEVFQKTEASAAFIASLFHYESYSINAVKKFSCEGTHYAGHIIRRSYFVKYKFIIGRTRVKVVNPSMICDCKGHSCHDIAISRLNRLTKKFIKF